MRGPGGWRALAVAGGLAALAGCKSASAPTGFGVNVTVDARALSAADRGRVSAGSLQITGAETVTKRLDVHAAIQSGELRFRYIPGVHAGSLTVAFDALDASDIVIAAGVADPVTLTERAVAVKITLAPGPGKKANGAPCAAAAECTSAFCVDGVCCNEKCDDACVSCALASGKGTCTPYPAGTDPEMECAAGSPDGGTPTADGGAAAAPGDDGGGPDAFVIRTPDGGTMSDPGVCGATCGGQRACKFPDRTRSCGKPFCNNERDVAAFVCDGNGGCGLDFAACADYACDDATGGCKTRCAAHTDCVPTNYCNGNNQCVPKKGMSLTCATDPECQSGHCSSGVCCNTQCDAPNSCNNSGTVGQCQCPGVSCAADDRCITFYFDGDRDGYGDPLVTIADCTRGTRHGGYIDNNLDCDDGDANVHPGQTTFFPTASRRSGTYDYDCNGTAEKQTPEYPGGSCRFCGAVGSCGSSTTTCPSANQQAVLSCTQSTYLCSIIVCPRPPAPCTGGGGSSCSCCGCSGGIFTPNWMSAGFVQTVACGQRGNYTTCGTCSAVGGAQASSTVVMTQQCR